MARVSEEEIERIKREVSIVALIESYGVKLSGTGDNLKGRCPLRGHDDRTPSLVVSPAKALWHCMGKCQTGGSVIDFVMKADGVSFRHAVEMLRKKTSSAVAKQSATRSKVDELAEPHEPDRVALLRVASFYHDIFKGTAEGPAYCEKRGLRNREVLEALRLGYSNRTLGYHLPEKRTKEGAAIHAQLQRLGVLRPSGHEHFVGSLVVPIFSEDGEVLEMYGRKIRDDLRKGTPMHLYLPRRPDGRRGVFNLPALKASKDVIICEALIDAITFLCAGIPNVTSAYGVEGFTKEMRDAFLENGIERVLVAYDRDEAGDRAAEKLAAELAKDGLSVFRVLFPKGMDANEYAQKVLPASKSLDVAVRNAQWMAGARSVAVIDALVERAPDVTPHTPESSSISEASIAPSTSQPNATNAEIAPKVTAAIDDAPAAASEIMKAPIAEVEPAAAAYDRPPAGHVAPETAKPEPPSLAADRATQHEISNAAERVGDDEICIDLGDRRWRVRGLARNTTYESLKLNIYVTRGESFFVDTIELYSARQRYAFVKATSTELGVEEIVIKSDVGKIVRQLEGLVHQQIQASLVAKPAPLMSETEREEAMALLRDPQLLDRILDDFDRAGVVGEENNKLVGYLAATSRKLEAPLAVVIQSSSAAGKSSLMDAVLRFMPEEERVEYSAMTGQSLFYMGETDLSHKILAVAEEQGVQSAEYALKLLQSEGKLKIASTGKDPNTGKLITHDYEVKGPVQIFLTTTAIEVDEELLNRCLVLTVDEGMKQTSAIHERQRDAQTLEGLLARRDRDRIVKLHQNAQRLLAPLFVANPFAKSLHFPNHTTRARRDHMKYLTLIRTIALLHQHQRSVKEVEHGGERIRYIEVTKADIAIADQLARAVLGHDDDDLPPQTRRLLELVEQMVAAEAKKRGVEPSALRFTRKDIRLFTKWSHSALKKHLARLEDLEHLLVHAGGARRRTIYELAKNDYDPSGHPQNASGHPLATGWSPPGARPDSIEDLREKRDLVTPIAKTHIRDAEKPPSYSPARSHAKLNGAARGA